jgi:hypothetical protein
MSRFKNFCALAITLIVLLGVSCRESELEGPELQDIFGDFEVLTTLTQDRTTVDFAAGESVEFIALLSIRTPWTLTIKTIGSTSSKIIEGNEKMISGDVARWNGSVTFAPLFAEGDQVIATLTFAEYPEATMTSDTITITGSRPLPEGGILVSDFEDPDQPLQAFSEFSFEETSNGIESLFPAAIGDSYWYMSGTDNNQSVFVCGLLVSSEAAQNTAVYEFPTENEDKVWFNCFVFGSGFPNTVMVIDFQEDDNLDGAYSPSEEGTYNFTINVDWTGWRLVSFPYSETLLSTNGGLGNIDANGAKEVDRIKNLQFILLSDLGQNDNPVAFGVDHPIFTVNGPFEP